MLAISLCQLFYSSQLLRQLQNTPGMLWQPAINSHFAALSKDQVRSMLIQDVPTMYSRYQAQRVRGGDYPESLSWLELRPDCVGRQTVRDQANCGSCWAFSTVNSFNDNRCIFGNDTVRVQRSEQFMVSCDANNMGCKGGNVAWAMEFILESGLPTEDCLRYTSGYEGVVRECPRNCDDGHQFKCQKATSYKYADGIEGMKAALQNATLAAVFHVFEDFMYYQSGVYSHVAGSSMGSHAIEVVGYGVESGVEYWLCKNSWGNYFGEDGYFRFQIGQKPCGMEEMSYQIIP